MKRIALLLLSPIAEWAATFFCTIASWMREGLVEQLGEDEGSDGLGDA